MILSPIGKNDDHNESDNKHDSIENQLDRETAKSSPKNELLEEQNKFAGFDKIQIKKENNPEDRKSQSSRE